MDSDGVVLASMYWPASRFQVLTDEVDTACREVKMRMSDLTESIGSVEHSLVEKCRPVAGFDQGVVSRERVVEENRRGLDLDLWS